MLIHKGKTLEQAVRKINASITDVSNKVKYTRRQIYNHFDAEDLPDDVIRRYAEALNYNFKDEFPDLYNKWVIAEPDPQYMLDKNKEVLEADVEKYRSLYIKALEEKQELLKEISQLKDKIKSTT